ncbi:MAG: hypothetical protein Cons2KO_04930 [Congregibacter sp.]
MQTVLTRRRVLLGGLKLSLTGGALLGFSACGEQGEDALVCADPGDMTSAQESVRRTLRYVEMSTDPARSCSGCDFFKPSASGACGSCEIFDGGPANPGGYCDSWSADA